jgi:signal transduction histidine kinase
MTALRDWTATVRSTDLAADHTQDGVEGAPAAVDPVGVKIAAERQRIALTLHDDVAPLLFAMATRIGRALGEAPEPPDGTDADPLRATLRLLDQELRTAQDRLRAVIRAGEPVEPAEAVPAATQRDVEAFTERTGVPAHLIVRGAPARLPAGVERVALHSLRQALVNVERHAEATVVVVTLEYRREHLCLVVQDDGRGLPAGYEPRAVPLNGHWGFTSMAEQVERLGGSVQLRRVPEGGTLLRVELPVRR